MSIFFTSDQHIGHKEIIQYDNRPFYNLEEMHHTIITNWNHRVKKEDEVYILGDFSLCTSNQTIDILKQLSGIKHLIIGNHDGDFIKYEGIESYFQTINFYAELKIKIIGGETKKVVLSHYFMPFYNDHYVGAVHLHGHSHNTKEHIKEMQLAKRLKKEGFQNEIFNVGCMHWAYMPVTLDEMLQTRCTSEKN